MLRIESDFASNSDETRFPMNSKWKGIALWLLPLALVLLIAWQLLGNSNTNNLQSNSSSNSLASRSAPVGRISYGRFLDYLKEGRVTSLDIYEGGRNALIEASDPELNNRKQKLRVDLPGVTPELINRLKEKNVSFDIHPANTSPPALGILGNLLFP